MSWQRSWVGSHLLIFTPLTSSAPLSASGPKCRESVSDQTPGGVHLLLLLLLLRTHATICCLNTSHSLIRPLVQQLHPQDQWWRRYSSTLIKVQRVKYHITFSTWFNKYLKVFQCHLSYYVITCSFCVFSFIQEYRLGLYYLRMKMMLRKRFAFTWKKVLFFWDNYPGISGDDYLGIFRHSFFQVNAIRFRMMLLKNFLLGY